MKRKRLAKQLIRGLGTFAFSGAIGLGSLPALSDVALGATGDSTPNAAGPQPAVQIKLMLAPGLPAKNAKAGAGDEEIVVRRALAGAQAAAPIPSQFTETSQAVQLSSSDELELFGSDASSKTGIKSSKAGGVSLPLQDAQQDTAARKLKRAAVATDQVLMLDPSAAASAKPSESTNARSLSGSTPERPRTAYGGAAPAPVPPGAKTLVKKRDEQATPKERTAKIATQNDAEIKPDSGYSALPSEAKPLTLELDADSDTSQTIHGGKDLDDAECPGSPESKVAGSGPQPDDVPLVETERPYDAPKAKRTVKPTQIIPPVKESLSDNQFSARELRLEQDINQTLKYFIDHPENIVRRGPWALMHATLPFGVETEIIAGRKKANAIGWMCYNGVCAKQRMFQPTRTGFRPNLGPGMQGHEGQFLAILAQSQVGIDYPIQIGRKRYTINDLVRYEMATCREKSELTFKLIGLSHYLPGDQVWRDNRRRSWNLEKIVAEELAQPVIGAACGGTHRLMGLSFALVQRQKDGLPMTGTWVRAEKYVNDYINYALSLQNPDGSFSTEWFKGRGMERDVERKVQTTGHIVEWLIFSLPDEHLRSEPIVRGVEFLVNSVGRRPSHDWPIGPRGHALRALALYNQRVFGAEVGKMEEHIAGKLNVQTIR